MDSFLIVGVIAVAALGGSSDLSESVLDDLFEDVRGNLRTVVVVGGLRSRWRWGLDQMSSRHGRAILG